MKNKTEVLFLPHLDTKDEEDVLNVLENIDDDLDRINVAMVKVHEREAFKEWGVSDKSSIFYFENGIPNIYTGLKGLKKLFHFHLKYRRSFK